jgi:aminoglycoside phosphotransferase (APT) family kinase protein
MAREFRVLEAVHPWFPPAPKVFLLCEDALVIGATFFLMERRHGVVLRRDIPADFARDPEFPRKASQGFIDCLAHLHSIDIERHGLATLGRPDGFLDRQLRGWTERWERAKTEKIPGIDGLLVWLAGNLPQSPRPTLVHNDFKLDNIMLAAGDPSRVEAVLDWEMATVGDPLVDLGCTLCYWTETGDPAMRGGAMSSITAQPGWLTRAELVRRYAEKTACDVSNLGYYEVFGLFKLGVILQQIYYRYHRGQTRDERFRDFHLRVRGLMAAAIDLAERMG